MLVYDEDQGLIGSKKDLLGRIWIPLEKKISMIPSAINPKEKVTV
jgi:hypothetical protein